MKLRLVFFDVEGTIFRKVKTDTRGNVAPSAWALIGRLLGEEAWVEQLETHRIWTEGGYKGYVEWCRATIEMHKRRGLTRGFFENVISSIEYHSGTHETFRKLREAGVYTALISGGFKAQADRAQRDLLIDHAFSACEYFWDAEGNPLWWNLLPCDYEGKVDFMGLIMKEHGISPAQCAFVGDGKNDIHLAKKVGVSVCFNGARELAEVCTHVIDQPDGEEDFRALVPILLGQESNQQD